MKTNFSALKVEEAIPLLKELGDGEAVTILNSLLEKDKKYSTTKLSELPDIEEIQPIKWRGTEHTYGFIESTETPGDFLNISPATTIEPDISLKKELINIKLGSLYTMNYPGWGRHNVLMHFKCKHAKENSTETAIIEFEQKFKSKEGESSGNMGDFIFIGLRVPTNGLQFEVQTVNVSNDGDDEALKILESDTIKNGLDLVNASFATLAPFTKMAQGVFGLLLSRNSNKIVQQFTIGFDFNASAVSIAKLRIGTYVVVQVKRDLLPWDKWVYQKSTGLVVNKAKYSERLPYNHLSFNVLKHESN